MSSGRRDHRKFSGLLWRRWDLRQRTWTQWGFFFFVSELWSKEPPYLSERSLWFDLTVDYRSSWSWTVLLHCGLVPVRATNHIFNVKLKSGKKKVAKLWRGGFSFTGKPAETRRLFYSAVPRLSTWACPLLRRHSSGTGFSSGWSSSPCLVTFKAQIPNHCEFRGQLNVWEEIEVVLVEGQMKVDGVRVEDDGERVRWRLIHWPLTSEGSSRKKRKRAASKGRKKKMKPKEKMENRQWREHLEISVIVTP